MQIIPHLQSRSSDTRQAAAAALAHISRAVGIWDPSSAAATSTDDQASTATEDEKGDLTLGDFDVAKVLAEGALLLSSSGKEYGKLSNLSAEELAKAQKDALGKLGLGFGGAENDIGVDVGAELAAGQEGVAAGPAVKTEVAPPRPTLPPPRFALPPPKFKNDPSASSESSLRSLAAQASPVASTSSLPIVAPPPPPPPPAASVSPAPAASAEEEDPYAGLSARERNKLKRKRKTEAKSGGPISTAPPAAKVRVVEAPKETNGAAASPAVAIKKEEPAEPAKGGEVVVVDPGAKARERERQGGEVQVDLEAKDRAEMEVKAGEWPWRGTVERLAVALLSCVVFQASGGPR